MVAGKPATGAYVLPPRRPVTGPGKAGRVHKGFRQDHRMPIDHLPIGLKAPRVEGQHFGRQIRDLDPRQNQKAGVIREEAQTRPLLGAGPPHPLVPGAAHPGRRRPAQQRHPGLSSLAQGQFKVATSIMQYDA